MSLQRRLLLILGGSFIPLWLFAAGLLYVHLDQQVSETLDQRLAASANMVAGLIARHPELLTTPVDNPLLVKPESDGVACQIRSATGQVLLQTNGAQDLLTHKVSTGFATRKIGETQWRLFTLNHKGVLITTADRMTERSNLQNGIIIVMVVPFTIALIGSLVALWLGVKRSLRPLQQLFQALSSRTPDNLEPVELHNAPAELQPVVETLNSLFVRVDRTVRREQRFASNAAHEFRTPLTAIKTHLQVAKKISGERQQLALTNAECGVSRLQRVTEQLLMLARLEQSSEWPDTAQSEVNHVIAEATTDLPQAERLDVQPAPENCVLEVPGILAAVAVRNLIENALKYSSRDYPVELRTFRANETFTFVIRDFGTPNPGAGQKMVIEATGNKIRGHGLGLAIVETIASKFYGNIRSQLNAFGGQDWILEFELAD